MRMPRTAPQFAAAAAAVLLATTACQGGDGDGELPAAGPLLQSAADEMAGLDTVAIRIEADADLAGLPLREVDAVVTRAGAAEGSAQVEQLGQRVEVRFVVLEDTFYYQLFGGWQQLPLAEATEFYDPSAVLDPDRGLAQLLRTATDPVVEGRDGDSYEVVATFAAGGLAGVLPGAPDGVRGTVWIGVDRPLLHRARLPVPAGAGSTAGGTLSVNLSEFDQPVEISAP
jgi:lipoprotein LprG